MKQPILGITTTIGLASLAVVLCINLGVEIVTGWMSVVIISLIPAQIILTLQLGSSLGGKHNSLNQPINGLVSSAVIFFFGALQFLFVKSITEGISAAPSPYSIMISISSVVVTLWMVIIFRGGFAAYFNNPLFGAISTWISSILLTCIVFVFVFDFSVFGNAPFQSILIEAHGFLSAWEALSLLITTAAVILALVLIEFYPFNKLHCGYLMVLGSTAFSALVSAAVWWVWVKYYGLDPVVYMVNGPVSVIFGEFILLVMLQNSLFSSLKQPIKGIVSVIIAVVFGLLIFPSYQQIVFYFMPDISTGAPFYSAELWIASTMLAVTFPMFVMVAEVFKFWPLSIAPADETRN